jgi:FkbM family methyltransferase
VNALDLLKILFTNPNLFLRKLKARIFPLRGRIVQEKIKGVIFEFDFSYDRIIEDMYFGNFEPETVMLMKKILKKGDIFIDIGANVGYLSAIAMGLVGKSGEVHSFEPVPEHCSRLRKLAILNKGYHLIVNQLALDEKEGIGQINITNLPNIGWNTMVPDFMPVEARQRLDNVITRRMDSYIEEKKLYEIALIKIDTEGYEFRILRGLSGYFEKTKYRPPIICEIAPSAYELLGCTLSQLAWQMDAWGYRAFSVPNTNVEVNIVTLIKTTNVVFLSK